VLQPFNVDAGIVSSARRTTLGVQDFPVAAARSWNALPPSVCSAPSLLQFRRDLQTAVFQRLEKKWTGIICSVTTLPRSVRFSLKFGTEFDNVTLSADTSVQGQRVKG